MQILFAVLILFSSLIFAEFTNLPNVPPGVFNASTRIEIKSTIAAAWDALTDFPAYANWNPFVRAAIILGPLLNLTLPTQHPVENKRLYLRVQIPPLPFPVNASTPENPLHTQISPYENITHVQPDLGRLAWKFLPEDVLDAERWSAISDIGGGMVLYESREVYRGAAAEALKESMGKGLQEGFDAQGVGLKMLLEEGI